MQPKQIEIREAFKNRRYNYFLKNFYGFHITFGNTAFVFDATVAAKHCVQDKTEDIPATP